MVYRNKIEPLRRYEVFLAGFCLQAFILVLKVLPFNLWSATCRTAVFNADTKSHEDMTQVHDCISKYRLHLLLGATCYLLGYPLIIGHLYYQHRKEETILSTFISPKYKLLKWLYNGSWFIIGTIKCTILPGMIVFTVYYDWEYIDEFKYVGYAMQFQFLHLILILIDSLLIPLGIATAIPWIVQITMLFPNEKEMSNIRKINVDKRAKIVGMISKCDKRGKYIFVGISIVCILIILFSSFADVFDYDKTGFFSLQGDSQLLWIVLYLMLQLQCMQYMRLTCRLPKDMFDK